jgi:hypothetical protein
MDKMLLAKLYAAILVIIMYPSISKDIQARNDVSPIYRTFLD